MKIHQHSPLALAIGVALYSSIASTAANAAPTKLESVVVTATRAEESVSSIFYYVPLPAGLAHQTL